MNHDARMAIEAVTQAMSSLSVLRNDDSSTTAALAHSHLRTARQLLVAKYQPNAEEIGR